jgi:D-glycero-alpha-D-manno-heptose 1-phosphate guanylyltransferase
VEGIVLAGGFGTRLHGVLKGVPKPLANMAGRPFLDFLLGYLEHQGFRHIILSVGYMHEQIVARFHHHYRGLDLSYSIEEKPLGTGGAVVASLTKALNEEVFVINGDTLFAVDFAAMRERFKCVGAQIMIALRPVTDGGRYGTVSVEGNRISAFVEKGSSGPALINAGTYLLSRTLEIPFPEGTPFSLEVDYLQQAAAALRPHAFVSDSFFIDIGVPDDFHRAQTLIPSYFAARGMTL